MIKSLVIVMTVFTILFSQSLIIVNVDNIKTEYGKIRIGVYNSKKDFPKKEAVYRGVNINSRKGSVEGKLSVEPGDYVVSLFHDVNDNGKLDKTLLGLPKEPYGFSNNIYGTFNRPLYEKSIITVADNDTITLSISLINN